MTLDEAAIEQLVAQARDGDAEAFGSLFDQYHEPVFRFIVSRIRNPTEAEDLAQIVFVKVLEALPRYESRGVPFGGWLFRLARNAVIDFVRTRRDHVELDALAERSGHDPGPHEQALLREDLAALSVALAKLTDEQRDVIALRFFAGLSAKEAAEAMDKQEGTIRGLQFRALAALRRELAPDVAAPGWMDRRAT